MSYWEQRQELKYIAGEKKINTYYKNLKKSFIQSKREIRTVINDFYVRYAYENKITYAQAQIRLSKAEIGELQDFIDRVNKNMGKYNLELNNMSIKARITRYQALEKQIDATLQQLYAIEYQRKGEELLKDVYSDSYYQTWYNIDQYHGFHSEFAQINPVAVDELIQYPFNGANFSTRLWKQKDYMLQVLNESITTMLIQGRNPNTLVSEFAKKFNTKEYEAYRLLHTEGSFIMEQASQKAYEEDGVEKYQWLATLDSKTCEDCQPLDGKIFEVGKGITGETLTPKHCFCRCTTAPYYDDDDCSEDTRIARGVDGKNIYVKGDMDYKTWYNECVNNNPKSGNISDKTFTNFVPNISDEAIEGIISTHKDVVNHGLKTGNERVATVFKDNGKTAYKNLDGTNNQVVFTNDITDFLTNAPKNSLISTHNHPASSSFSDADLNVLNKYKSIDTITVQGHDGTKYMCKVGKGTRLGWDEIHKSYQDLKSEYFNFYQGKIYKDKSFLEDAWKEHSHNILSEMAKQNNWEYKRIVTDDYKEKANKYEKELKEWKEKQS
ncbi:MAG: minor capsid protein [Clostridia bacterium]|nr:minor capsid protein [Clostridia bacterium]